MRILDKNNVELNAPDLSLGKLVEDKVFLRHHEAVAAIEEQWHYETVAEYPNGGKDVQKVVDVPGVGAQEAWDEYEEIMRYIPYTAEELEHKKAMEDKPMPLDIIEAQVMYTAMMTDTLLEV